MVDSAHFQPDDRPVDDQLADLRVRIDAVDQQLIALINQRARLAQAVGEVKKLDGSPVFRPDREAQVIDGLKRRNTGPLLTDSIALYADWTFDLTRRLKLDVGARYTDDHEAVWWNKGEEGFVEMRDKDGEWQSVYNDCKQQ